MTEENLNKEMGSKENKSKKGKERRSFQFNIYNFHAIFQNRVVYEKKLFFFSRNRLVFTSPLIHYFLILRATRIFITRSHSSSMTSLLLFSTSKK